MLMLRVPPAMSGSGPAVDWELVVHFNGTRAKELQQSPHFESPS
ncbi:hypothetical protein PF001_g30278 [Phytophthora fragariae]|uniref:Uncharacterized protein n=1 Tax=Phytophthora fragariae TaxID=53985 RepID=A0A6A4B5Q7_9STRA|nr:hypothetical protein PF001_g30278 [Phytophthora fragariae]